MRGWFWSIAAALSCSCGGSHPGVGDNRVFYHSDIPQAALGELEAKYPPLDHETAHFIGVSLFQSAIRFSRPADWVIRRASSQQHKRFVEYVSPRQLLFTVYERVESPSDSWQETLANYEKETKADGAELLSEATPVATANAQGRAYEIQRTVEGGKEPFVTLCREYLLRGQNRVVLIQMIHQRDNLQPYEPELLRVIRTLEVL